MKESFRQILPGIGLGSIKFGMYRQEVYDLLGLPNEIEIYQYSPNTLERSESWFYEEAEISISFSSEDDWKLDTISINLDYYILWDSIKIGDTFEIIEAHLIEKGRFQYNIEDWATLESPTHKLIEIKEEDINLWFDDGKLSEIQWGPKYLDENTIDWPYRSEGIKKNIEIGVKRYSIDFLFNLSEQSMCESIDELFENQDKYERLLYNFPSQTERENIHLECRSIRYLLKMAGRNEASIMVETRIIHNEFEEFGSLIIEYDKELSKLDEYYRFD